MVSGLVLQFRYHRQRYSCLFVAELARSLARTANLKDKSIINDEIALVMVMDLMAMGELRNKERLADRANIRGGAKGMEQIRIIQKQFIRLIDGTHSRPAPHTMNKPPCLKRGQIYFTSKIVSGPAGKETIHYIAPPKNELENEMDVFLNWVNINDEHNPLLKAGIAHLWFIMIHPFDDGNGRVGRAITDYIMSLNYPSLMRLISFSKHFSLDRKGYYAVLEEAGKQGLNITAWLKWFLQTSFTAMQEAQWIVERVMLKAQFWQLHKDTPLNSRQLKVINRLLDAGEKFEGVMTTRKYAGITKCSKVTASRDLSDLIDKKILQKTAAGGSSTSYELTGSN